MERRSLIYTLILVTLVITLGVVGVLILRKRSGLPLLNPIVTQQPKKKMPTDTKPFDSFPKASSWKPGDPAPTSSPYEAFPPIVDTGF